MRASAWTRAFVVTDSGMTKHENFAGLLRALDEAEVPYVLYAGAMPNPDDISTDAAAAGLWRLRLRRGDRLRRRKLA